MNQWRDPRKDVQNDIIKFGIVFAVLIGIAFALLTAVAPQ